MHHGSDAASSCLSLAKLYRQLAVGGLDQLQFVFSLIAHCVLEPGCFVIFVVASGTWATVPDGLEALVEEMGILFVLGRLLGDLGECAWLRNGNQLPKGDGC